MNFTDRKFVVCERPETTNGWSPARYAQRFDGRNRISFRRCRFRCEPEAGLAGFAVFRGCRDVVFEDCLFGPMNGTFHDEPHHALAFYGDTRGVRVERCRFEGCHWGVALGVGLVAGGENCFDGTVSNCTFANVIRAAVSGGCDGHIVNNTIRGATGSAIALGVGGGEVSHDVVVSGNLIETPDTCCIQFDANAGHALKRITITDNILHGVVGIAINKADRVFVRGNMITIKDVGPNRIGIAAGGIRDLTITDNDVEMHTIEPTNGILVGECDEFPLNHAVVANNRVIGSGPLTSNGILFYGKSLAEGYKTIQVIGNTVEVEGAKHGIMFYPGAESLIIVGNHATGHQWDLRDMTPDGDGRIVAHNRFQTILRN